ncbi:MAG: SLOG family protein [Persicimonas sp.]
MSRVIIAGSRDITEPQDVFHAIKIAKTSGMAIDEVVTGGARGVDTIAHEAAKRKGVATKVFPANWDEHGKAAGPIRNREMAEYADALLAVWDGESRGTSNMIAEARKRGLEVFVVVMRGDQ